jgi:predicted dehydrogenase
MKQTSRRQFLAAAAVTGVMTSTASRKLSAANSNEEIGVGFVGLGIRGKKLLNQFNSVEGVNIVALCDADSGRVATAQENFPKANTYSDMRKLFADPAVDAVVIATCNHWHCLAAIWAMEAGKDVYVEKPLGHTQWEGDQVVAATEKYDRICQVGTQQRSDPMQAEIKKFLHEEKALGEIMHVRVNRFGIRKPIGKRSKPLAIDKNVDYDLWCGPAKKQPIFRDQLHYDWHWDWNTGSGEMGNWGVHIIDDVRNNIFQDSVAMPKGVMAGGGRLVWDDAGQTPNVLFAYLDTGSHPVVIGLTNLPAKPGSKEVPRHPGSASGYIAFCDGGRFEGQRGRARAFDSAGKLIREFKGNRGDVLHQANFIEAVRHRDRTKLNADVIVGNDSTNWCNLANVASRVGGRFSEQTASSVSLEQWKKLLASMDGHLKAHGLSLADQQISLSPLLKFDAETGAFVGDGSDAANGLLKREYRNGFEVPEVV